MMHSKMREEDDVVTELLVPAAPASSQQSPSKPELRRTSRDMGSFLGKPKASQHVPEKKAPPAMFQFDQFPLWLREGKWTWSATLFIPAVTILVASVAPQAMATMPMDPAATQAHSPYEMEVALAGLVWTLAVTAHTAFTSGAWIFMSFTMMSWLLLTARFAAVLMGRHSHVAWVVGELVRGPALLNAVFLGLVWWLALVPLIAYFSPTKKARKGFLRFNFSATLINIHLLNMPLAFLGHRLAPRDLCLFDLWATCALSLLYLLFYLAVMDPNGLHLYIILSPRTNFSIASYSGLLGLMVALFRAFGGSFALST